MKFEHKDYFRIPRELTQEDYPLSFQFYNCLIPLLKMNNQECYQTYLADCDKIKKEKALDFFVNLTKNAQIQKQSRFSKSLDNLTPLAFKKQKNPELLENLSQFGRLDTSFLPSKTFRFVKKPYGMPSADSGPSLSNPDIQV